MSGLYRVFREVQHMHMYTLRFITFNACVIPSSYIRGSVPTLMLAQLSGAVAGGGTWVLEDGVIHLKRFWY